MVDRRSIGLLHALYCLPDKIDNGMQTFYNTGRIILLLAVEQEAKDAHWCQVLPSFQLGACVLWSNLAPAVACLDLTRLSQGVLSGYNQTSHRATLGANR
jgi:hypothetical protein